MELHRDAPKAHAAPDTANLTRRAEPAPTLALAAMAAAGLAAFAVLTVLVARFTVDDAWITLRYARSLASGAGLTFNPGGPRAEGYSSLLWTVLLAVPHVLGLPAVAAAKALGIACTAATLALAARWAAREDGAEGGARWAAAAAVLWLASLPPVAVHAVSGMETALAALLLTALFALAADGVRAGRAGAPLALAALAAAFTRPEGALAGAVVLAATLRELPRGARAPLARAAVVAFALPLAAHEAWRLAWYGLPLPLPFYVKLANPAPLPGLPVVGVWLRDLALRLGLPLALLLARPPRTLRPALAGVGALTFFFILPQHLMGYQHRYLAPLDPAVCVCAGLGLSRLAARLARSRLPRAAGIACVLALAAGGAALELADAPVDIGERLHYADGMAAAHERLGRALAAAAPAGRLAISDAGAAPYLSRWWTLDMIGLNDARIATTRDRSPAAILSARPDVVVLVSRDPSEFRAWRWNPWEQPLLPAAERAGFRRVGLLRFGADYWLWVLARPATTVGRALEASLR